MSKGGGNTTTVQKADPWEAQQPYLKRIFKEAQNLYETAQPEYYKGNTIAPFTHGEKMGMARARRAIAGDMSDVVSGAADSSKFLSKDVLNADSNPYIAQHAQGAIRPVFQELQENVLPQISRDYGAAGQLGGSRQGIAEGKAVGDATQRALETTSKIYSDAYDSGLDAMVKNQAFAPQTAALTLAPGTAEAALGQQERDYQQALINEAMKEHAFNQSIPWDTLAAYQNTVQGSFGGTGVSTQSVNPSQGQQILGGLGAGLSTYSALSAIPAFAPAAPFAAGAAVLLSMF